MADTKEIAVDMDTTLGNLRRAMRELSFHAGAAAGAEQGLQDCLGDEDTEDRDLEIWAKRVSATYQAVSEMAHIVSVEANILGDICTPTDTASEH